MATHKVADAFTSEEFWESFWKNVTIPVQYDPDFNNDRAIGDIIMRFAPGVSDFSKKAIEIGCAPGKWMLFLLGKLGYTVHGCEYIRSGVEKTRQNFEYFHVPAENYRIFQGDFFTLDLECDYDLVLSLGFIEHFKDFRLVMERHLALLKKGGLMIVGLPRFIGINWLIQMIIDRHTADKARRYLPLHNLRTMNLRIFRKFAASSGCELVFNEFVGGFERALFPVEIVPSARVREMLANWLLAFTNSKSLKTAWYGASYQMCIMRKR
jgi:SAM-dependent methyltransferase